MAAEVAWQWHLSSLCDSFHLPLVAGGALDQPYALLCDIAELRAFAHAVDLVNRAELAKTANELPDSPLIEMVTEVERIVVLASKAHARARAEAKRAAARAAKTQRAG